MILRLSILLFTLPVCSSLLSVFPTGSLNILIIVILLSQCDNFKIYVISEFGHKAYVIGFKCGIEKIDLVIFIFIFIDWSIWFSSCIIICWKPGIFCWKTWTEVISLSCDGYVNLIRGWGVRSPATVGAGGIRILLGFVSSPLTLAFPWPCWAGTPQQFEPSPSGVLLKSCVVVERCGAGEALWSPRINSPSLGGPVWLQVWEFLLTLLFQPPQVRQGGQGTAVSGPSSNSGSDTRFWLSLSPWTADLCHGEHSGCISSWLLPPPSARAKRCFLVLQISGGRLQALFTEGSKKSPWCSVRPALSYCKDAVTTSKLFTNGSWNPALPQLPFSSWLLSPPGITYFIW